MDSPDTENPQTKNLRVWISGNSPMDLDPGVPPLRQQESDRVEALKFQNLCLRIGREFRDVVFEDVGFDNSS